MTSPSIQFRRRSRPQLRRAPLTAIGVALAAAMLSSAIVIADGLGNGFARAARAADLPDVIVRFDPQARGLVVSRIRALPDIAAFSTREEVTNVDIGAGGHSSGQGSAEVVGAGISRAVGASRGHVVRVQAVQAATVAIPAATLGALVGVLATVGPTAGGYWLISTASLIDYPQQARALRVLATAEGGVAIQTWMLDHVFPGRLGTISRQLAYLDAQGGRPQSFIGDRLDRNATLYRAAVNP